MTDFYMPVNGWGGGGRNKQGASTCSTEEIVLEFCAAFSMTPYRLSKILGVQSGGSIYRWLDGSRTLSAIFLARMVRLLLWESRGLPIHEIEEILWVDSLILWKNGNVTLENHGPDGEGVVSATSETWRTAVNVSFARQRMVDLDLRRGRLSIKTTP